MPSRNVGTWRVKRFEYVKCSKGTATISGNGTGGCVTNSVPFGRVLKAFARVFVIEENRRVHQKII
jgi:hypothetical protein